MTSQSALRENIEQELAAIRDAYNQLDSIHPVSSLSKDLVRSAAFKERVKPLLYTISGHGYALRSLFSRYLSEAAWPLIRIDEALKRFYDDIYVPQESHIASLFFAASLSAEAEQRLTASIEEVIGSKRLASPGEEVGSSRDPLVDILDRGLYMVQWRWEEGEYDDEDFASHDVGGDLEDLSMLLQSDLFQPAAWVEQLKELRPILSFKEPDAVPFMIRQGLREIYRSLIFGNFIAAGSLCRSVLERAIVDWGRRCNVSTVAEGGKRNLRLAQLVDVVSGHLPQLEDSLEIIVSHGNALLHADSPKASLHPQYAKRMPAQAFKELQTVIAMLYSAPPRPVADKKLG